MGQSYEIYNLITSPSLQINSRFVPYFRLPDQVVPTGIVQFESFKLSNKGTMMGEIGFKFATHKLHLNANSSIATLDSSEISLKNPWSLTFEDVTIVNKVNGRMYELEFNSRQVSITFIQKLYVHKGVPDQWHFDYKAALHGKDHTELHG